MEINGTVEVQGFTTIEDLECGTVFVFCDDNEPMLKGDNCDYQCAIRLSDGKVFDVWDEHWCERPVRQIKAVLTIK